jgi:hypothetical protein
LNPTISPSTPRNTVMYRDIPQYAVILPILYTLIIIFFIL